jgi:aspartyl-tRNA(Asn)/glutamyl-tRNA(Gln) amidotransferase subunit A
MVVAVKDVIDVRGLPTSQGVAELEPVVPDADAEAVRRLRAAGAVIAGKARTSPFQWLPDTPPVLNPLDPALWVGGSSGGAAAAVAAGLVRAAIGTDTGGSIRWPAALCGVVGVKPTYGAVSLRGVLPSARSCDVAGPIAATVADARAVLAALVGADATTAPAARLRPLAARLAEPVAAAEPAAAAAAVLGGARVAVLRDPLVAIEDPRVLEHFDATRARLAGAGATVVELELPLLRFAPAALMAISLAEASHLAPLLRERPEVLPGAVRSLLHVGLALPAALVERARAARAAIQRAVAQLYRDHELDALLLPASVGPAPRRGIPDGGAAGRASELSALASVTGQPALTLPVAAAGDPVSVQLAGRPFADDRLLDIAAALEALTPRRTAPAPRDRA